MPELMMTDMMMTATWTPPRPADRRPAPTANGPAGPGLDRSDIPSPLPGRPLWVIFGTLLAIAGLGWGTFNVVELLAHDEFEKNETLSARGVDTIVVDNNNGWVEIVGTDADVISIHAEISRGLRDTGWGWETEGSTVRAHGTCPIVGSLWCWVKYRIEVPRGLDVVVDNDNSRVSVSGIDGDVTIDADNGRVVLAGIAGRVDVDSDNGRVAGTGLSGVSADIRSDNGRIEVAFSEAPESVTAESDNGSIDIAVPPVDEGYAIRTHSDNGRQDTVGLVADPSSPRTIEATSGNGSVTVRATG